MFNSKIIQTKRDRASIHLIQSSPLGPKGETLFKPGFQLIEHAIIQADQATNHLATILAEDRTLKRPFNTEEKRWIANERALCACSFRYWATRYGFIVDWGSNLVRFSPSIGQEIILDFLSELEGEEAAMILQILKARQMGVTTLSELILLWRTMFHPWTTTLVASSRPEKSAEMAEKMRICYERQPYWLVPRIETYKTGELWGFNGINSTIHIRHGAMMSGMGRGLTASAFHLSEVSEFINPEDSIDAALLRAAHDNPTLIGLLESTANGKHGWWYDKWNFNIERWPLRQSRMCPVFLPWYLLRELYPTATWLKTRPVPKDWIAPELASNHAKKAAEYVQSGENQTVTRILGSNWEMPIEQIWWWWITREEMVQTKQLHKFYQELCANPLEAFQNANSSVFDSELIYELQSETPMPVGVYGIMAPSSEVPKILQANERDIDPNQAPIHIRADWNPTGPSHSYTLVPLLHRGSAPFSPTGKIIIYEFPEAGESYGIGTDCGMGVEKDFSALVGIRKGSYNRRAAQVFEYAANNVNSFNLWPINLALGTLFSTKVNGKIRQAKQVIEGAANGEVVYNELKKRGWREFHNWVRYDRKRQLETKANRQLWYTVEWSRKLLMEMLLDAVNSGWFEVRSPSLIDELSDLEIDYDKLKIAAAGGKHDDRVMALGMVLFSMHALETKHLDRWTSRTVKEEGPKTFPCFSPGTQGNDISERVGDATRPYRYAIVRPGDPQERELAQDGASLPS